MTSDRHTNQKLSYPRRQHCWPAGSTNDLDDLLDKTRDERDIFHVFDELPIPQNNPVRTLISCLLIHATFLFDAEDYENVAEYLAEEKAIHSLEDLLKDFYF
jgi:hypothetical protein